MIVSWTIGFLLALLINKVWPQVAEDGRLIWVLPSVLLMMAFCSELFRKEFLHVLKEFFFPTGGGEENLVFVFATVPTYSCIAYSIGASSRMLNFIRKAGNLGQ
jgi:hypothetical protein